MSYNTQWVTVVNTDDASKVPTESLQVADIVIENGKVLKNRYGLTTRAG